MGWVWLRLMMSSLAGSVDKGGGQVSPASCAGSRQHQLESHCSRNGGWFYDIQYIELF